MKKEKRRLTLKQLENIEQIIWKLFTICGILFFVVIGIILIIIPINSVEDLIPVLLGIGLFLAIIMMISIKILEIIRKRISTTKEQMKVRTLKQLAKEHGGHIRAFVNIKDNEIITDILSKNIVKIVIDDIEGPNLVTSIKLEDNTWQTRVYIPSEKLISILDEKTKNEIIDHLITYIKLGNLDGNTTEVTMSKFLYSNPKATDEELLKIFELKE